MTKNNKIYLSKQDTEKFINGFGEIISKKLMNEVSNQFRYEVKKEEITFKLDVYYRKDKTITLTAIPNGNEKSKELSEELKKLIANESKYKDVAKASFIVKIKRLEYEELINYLKQENLINLEYEKDNGVNGLISLFTSNYGDKATLTYYETTGNLRFQGLMMSLYVAVRDFTLPMSSESSEVKVEINQSILDIGNEIQQFIDMNIRIFYKNSTKIMQNFIHDSINMLLSNSKLNDFTPWTVPMFRVLEYSIKNIIGENDIVLDNKKGFMTGQKKNIHIFIEDINGANKHKINKLAGIDEKYNATLIGYYEYWSSNRHGLFHANQVGDSTVILETSDKARTKIIDICKLLEKSCEIV